MAGPTGEKGKDRENKVRSPDKDGGLLESRSDTGDWLLPEEPTVDRWLPINKLCENKISYNS